MLSTV